MKRSLLTIIALLIYVPSLLAQPCEPFKVRSRKQTKVLNEYIHLCESLGYLKGDTGMIMLHQRQDKLGELEWYIGVSNKDNYQDRKAPIGWSIISNKLVFWYDNLNSVAGSKLTESELSCLTKIVGNRVSKRMRTPPATPLLDISGKPRLDKNGKPIMVTQHISERFGVNLHIIFKKDGSVIKLSSV